MATFKIIPTVDETQEFLEIANNFSNPLELVREAISNAFDAKAKTISIVFTVGAEFGERVLYITITDDGHGMDKDGLQSFFDLGNSLRRGDPTTIGEKGHGTKVYFHSSSIEVTTTKDGHTYPHRPRPTQSGRGRVPGRLPIPRGRTTPAGSGIHGDGSGQDLAATGR